MSLATRRFFPVFLGIVSVLCVCAFATPATAAAVTIPAFTPNVVDPYDRLDAAAEQSVNEALERIRDQSNVWGAVFIVETLGGHSIEEVAEQAFRKWQLGEKGVDNGLLLVLAMRDRKSRFEVGYGLEGAITDVHARRALDDHLAPKMRAGDTAGAIIDAFTYLSRQVSGEAKGSIRDTPAEAEALPGALPLEAPDAGEPEGPPSAIGQVQPASDPVPEAPNPILVFLKTIVVLLSFAGALWAFVPLRVRWENHRRAKLTQRDPSLGLRDDAVETRIASTEKGKVDAGDRFFNITFPLFLAAFPAALAGLAFSDFPGIGTFLGFLVAPLPLLLLLLFATTRDYSSPKRYRRRLDAIAALRAEYLRKGYLEEKSPGVYSYTDTYRASRRSGSSSSYSSSGRSSGGSRSSSGGGRSGGGGASSGW